MAPVARPAGEIKVRVPRHNAQRLGAKLTAEIKSQAAASNTRIDIYQPSQEAIIQAVENASEWNSLVLTARAERGPQWDIGTQRFHVDQYSELYYDSTVLAEAAKKQFEEETKDEQPPQPPQSQPVPQREPPRDLHLMNPHNHNNVSHPTHDAGQYRQAAPMGYQYPPNPRPMQNQYSGGPPFNPMPGQYYNQQPHDNSPMRMASMPSMAGGMPNQFSGGPPFNVNPMPGQFYNQQPQMPAMQPGMPMGGGGMPMNQMGNMGPGGMPMNMAPGGMGRYPMH